MFSFLGFGKRKKPAPKSMVRPQAGTGQKRSAFRMPVEFEVTYALDGRPGRRRARANDLSAGGLRLATDEDLVRGSTLELEFQLPDDFLAEMTIEKEVYEQTPFGLRPETVKVQPPSFKPMRMNAVVLMPFFDRIEKKFAYGTRFSGTQEETQEELQRFIHLWQIHYLRTRHGD
ncbi:MAG: PilZ domain-containing protein [Candidatus Eremiobacteraeota bacterium]|nr:PilZ domain-containing protein [Candidatus Eremiobacteraeota bacterium]MBV8333007.1 PilZ domain-containing protein [Candidatus Eremiobacteraeota bacterium]